MDQRPGMNVSLDNLVDLGSTSRVAWLREWRQGRRQRLFPLVCATFRRLLESLVLTTDAATQLGGLYLLHGGLAARVRHSRLAPLFAAELGRVPLVEGELREYLEPAVARIFAETQLHRQQLTLPPDLAADLDLLRALAEPLGQLLDDWPVDFWEAVELSGLTGGAAAPKGGALLLVPPPTLAESRPGRLAERPEPGAFPAELAAATPARAQVLDARAERLFFDETLAAVLAIAPEQLILYHEANDEVLGALRRDLRSLLPGLDIIAVTSAPTPVLESCRTIVLGPPWRRLAEALNGSAEPLLEPGTPGPIGDLARWPLACYRQSETDADVILPASGRSGRALAEDLRRAARLTPPARLRLGSLSPAQATELLAAVDRPAPPPWWLSLAGPTLPAPATELRRAGLTTVVLEVGPTGQSPTEAAANAETLVAAGLEVRARLETTAATEDLAALATAPLAAVSFHGPGAAALQAEWHRRR